MHVCKIPLLVQAVSFMKTNPPVTLKTESMSSLPIKAFSLSEQNILSNNIKPPPPV